MFNFSQLKQLHLEITNNCQASCPMCTRNIHGGLENPLVKIQNWSLEEFKIIVNERTLAQIEGLYFCGNFGDPILNNDLIDMCEYVKNQSPKQHLRVHTNGSARSTAWWAKLAKAMPAHHRVVFALDGLSDTHSVYRIGTNFETILKNAQSFINEGGIAEWCFIKFKHNEHQVEDAKKLAATLGFKHFTVKNSSRFILEPKYAVFDNKGNTIYHIEPPTEHKMTFINKKTVDSYKQIVNDSTIECHSEKSKEVYIDAFRNVFPCCWIAMTPYNYIEKNDYASNIRYEILNQYHALVESLGGIESLNAITNTIEDIIDSKEYQTVWNEYWDAKKLITCARTCGRMPENNISKPADQFVEMSSLNV